MAEYMEIVQNIVAEVKKAVIGKDESIRKVMAGILAGGQYFNRGYSGGR